MKALQKLKGGLKEVLGWWWMRVAFLVLASLAIMGFLLQPADITDLGETLAWLALGPGAVYVAGRALAILLEKLPGWGTYVPESLRPWIVILLGVGLSFGAQYLLSQAEVLATVAPVYKHIVTIIVAWLGSQQEYNSLKHRGLRGKRA